MPNMQVAVDISEVHLCEATPIQHQGAWWEWVDPLANGPALADFSEPTLVIEPSQPAARTHIIRIYAVALGSVGERFPVQSETLCYYTAGEQSPQLLDRDDQSRGI